MRGFKLNVGLDVDEIVYECIQYAVDIVNKKYDYNPPISIDEVTGWGKTGKRSDIILECFNDPEFFRTQPIIEGAKDFVKKLCKIANVFFVTAIAPEFMGIRVKRLMEDFPEVPKENIIMTSSKNVIQLDILFDDGAHNIMKSIAKYPILRRKPWNANLTGALAVNNYNEFFTIIHEIQKNYVDVIDDPEIIALVGPSGSGKTAITNEILKINEFEKPVPFTTRDPRPGEINGNEYYFVTKKDFQKRKNNGEFFETTAYAGNFYGTNKEMIDDILKRGKKVIIPVDICGAMTLKNKYKNVLTVFVKRDKKVLLESLLSRNVSNQEKVERILSLDTEDKNKEICDIILKNDVSIENVAANLLKQIETIRA